MRKIVIITSDNGTGKTTTAVNLGHSLALCGMKVLIVDCDVRRDAAFSLDVQAEKTLCDLLQYGEVDAVRARENLYVVDSGGRCLTDVEMVLARQTNRERRLELALKNLKGCDVVICDCSSTISLISINALTFADHVIVPVSMNRIAGAGARQTLRVIDEINAIATVPAGLLGFLPTFYDENLRLSQDVLDSLRRRFRGDVFETVIRESMSLREAPGFKQTVFEYSPKSDGAYDYYQLTEEFLSRVRL